MSIKDCLLEVKNAAKKCIDILNMMEADSETLVSEHEN